MKVVVLLVLALVAVTTAFVIPTKGTRKAADTEFLERQKNILDLLIGVGHESTFENEYESFDILEAADQFTNGKIAKEFQVAYKRGFLEKDAVFTMSCGKTRYQTQKLFELFVFAKDFDTFYKVASWARQNVNGGQFVYAFYVAVFHRPDCRGFTLPSLYEVFPNEFVPTEYLHKIFDVKMEGMKDYVFYLNNTGYEQYYHGKHFEGILFGNFDSPNQNVEDRLSYFREDVGLGEYFTQMFSYYPSWIDQTKLDVSYFRRGEIFYYMIQQLFARYSLERIANGLPHTELLFFDRPIKVGYNSRLSTFNGHTFFPRPDNVVPQDFNPIAVDSILRIERRILDSIDVDRFYSESNTSWVKGIDYNQGYDIVGNILLGTTESVGRSFYKYYFYQALETLGMLIKTSNDKGFVTSAVGNIVTAPRDPAFYSLLHRTLLFFQRYQQVLPKYKPSDLIFPGVKIQSFDVDKLVTYFDRFDFDVNNAVPISGGEGLKEHRYVAKQFRINHKPFNYRLTVTSDKATVSMVRVFVGPKYDAEGRLYSLEQARPAFVEFDRFPFKLTSGQNVIERNSKESTAYVEDPESFKSFYQRVESSIDKKTPFYVTESYRCGMPDRFLLPKGWKSGQPFVFYAIVTPFDKETETPPKERYFDNFVLCGGSKYYDGRSQGFPFDRSIYFQSEFVSVPNSYFKDVLVFHKDEFDVNKVEI